MASVSVNVTSSPQAIALNVPAGRVVATIMSSPAEVYITADGSTPTAPTTSINPSDQRTIPGVVGGQTVIVPPQPGGHMQNTVINIASAGTPVVQLEW